MIVLSIKRAGLFALIQCDIFVRMLISKLEMVELPFQNICTDILCNNNATLYKKKKKR